MLFVGPIRDLFSQLKKKKKKTNIHASNFEISLANHWIYKWTIPEEDTLKFEPSNFSEINAIGFSLSCSIMVSVAK